MTLTRSLSTVFMLVALLVEGSESFAVHDGSWRKLITSTKSKPSSVLTLTLQSLHRSAFLESREPSTTTAFLRRGRDGMDEKSFSTNGARPYSGQQPHGHLDTSAEGDPPAPAGIDNKGGDDGPTKNAHTDNNSKNNNNVSAKKGYQRAEDWDAEQKTGALHWEQRVQFDGLRMGNHLRQNEILQRHLSSF